MMRLAIVSGICVDSDAISAAVEAQAKLALSLPGVGSVTVFAQHLGRELPCPSFAVASSWELLRHPEFRDVDVAIFHWGIHYQLFDALVLLEDAGPRPVCHFHNCTPEALVDDGERDVIRKSMVQAHLLTNLDVTVWTFSRFNELTLEGWGVPERRISFVPFPVEAPRVLRPHRCTDHVDMAVVGRLVPAKGQHVILAALALLPKQTIARISVRVAGNATFSSRTYVDRLKSMVHDAHLEECVEFVGQVDDESLWQLYERSQIMVTASFHEGLCVPVIESYLAGCRVVGTTAGNLPFIVAPGDFVVPPNDPEALARSLDIVVHQVLEGEEHDTSAARSSVEGYSVAASRLALQRALDDVLERR